MMPKPLDYCTAPSVDNLSDLSGQKMDHEEEITGMQCSSNYKIQGGSTVKCVDGTLTYSASNTETENTEPKCIGKRFILVRYDDG